MCEWPLLTIVAGSWSSEFKPEKRIRAFVWVSSDILT
jgi:hypothetical protein